MRTARKHLLSEEPEQSSRRAGEIDILASATLGYSSEKPGYPVEHVFDGSGGRGATRWIAAQPDTTDRIIIEFEQTQSISRLIYEVEETELERTQEVRVEVRFKGFDLYNTILTQQYCFSPAGSTYQREDLRLTLSAVTDVRLTIVPNQSGHGSATLTQFQLFA
jgi:hypothetical protein